MPEVPERYQQAMSDLYKSAEADLLIMEKRAAIRERSLIARTIAAIQFLGKAGYRDAGGWKAFLRDIVG